MSKLLRADWETALATSTTVYLGNLAFTTREEQLYDVFGRVGHIKRIVMGLDKMQKTPCGFAFAIYYTRRDAEEAVAFLNGTLVDERAIRVDLDWGFVEGRQYGRGRSGGQVRDEFRQDFDPGRGGYGRILQAEMMEQMGMGMDGGGGGGAGGRPDSRGDFKRQRVFGGGAGQGRRSGGGGGGRGGEEGAAGGGGDGGGGGEQVFAGRGQEGEAAGEGEGMQQGQGGDGDAGAETAMQEGEEAGGDVGGGDAGGDEGGGGGDGEDYGGEDMGLPAEEEQFGGEDG
ncbi:hypothetical protein GPECTOR_43g923 [Gonium pectorale]|uniref:Nuclear cap-binding protein subunit 2 n=1 Tax=Gonium pectorale TaxID=33097 RepID=A0A150G9G1_GONPE|nr:hypothetical protein GPECTOR_43g923 [Gonium pectorale]|eukprot:KXZ46487.1 hypothetical protein GPECTOR_43g923 [Gonium pectorale]